MNAVFWQTPYSFLSTYSIVIAKDFGRRVYYCWVFLHIVNVWNHWNTGALKKYYRCYEKLLPCDYTSALEMLFFNNNSALNLPSTAASAPLHPQDQMITLTHDICAEGNWFSFPTIIVEGQMPGAGVQVLHEHSLV